MDETGVMLLDSAGACDDGMAWALGFRTLREAWETCSRSDWMLWALRRIDFNDDRRLLLFACSCVRDTPIADGRTLWDLLTDERSRTAVEVATRYADGKATEEELATAGAAALAFCRDTNRDAAQDTAALAAAWVATALDALAAATVACAAAGCAAAVAYKAADCCAAQTWQATLLRQWISWDEVETAIKTYRKAKGI